MLALACIAMSLTAQIGRPQGVSLLEDAPVAKPTFEARLAAQQIQIDLEALRQIRTGLGGAVAMLAGGGSVTAVGGFFFLVESLAGITDSYLVIGAMALVVGLQLIVIGVWLLYNRLTERAHIAQESRRLKEELKVLLRTSSSQPLSPSAVVARF